jgi:hypothetical protein
MRFYKLTPEERAKIEAFNATQKNTLLIICDHGEGRIGIEADDIESPTFKDFFAELGNLLESARIINIDKTTLEAV